MATFRSSPIYSASCSGAGLEVGFHILTSGFWPTYPVVDCRLPPALASAQVGGGLGVAAWGAGCVRTRRWHGCCLRCGAVLAAAGATGAAAGPRQEVGAGGTHAR